MWYRYAEIEGIKDFTKGPKKEVKNQSDLKSMSLLPPLHDNCRCKIVQKNGLYQWLVELEPCNQCLEAQARFNLEQNELKKMKPIIEPSPDISSIQPINPIHDTGGTENLEDTEDISMPETGLQLPISDDDNKDTEIPEEEFIEAPEDDFEELEDDPEEEIVKPLRRMKKWYEF